MQPISQKDFRENNVQVIKRSFLFKETHQPEEKLVFISEHIPNPSNEFRGLDEKTNQCSMLNPAENDIKQNFTHLFPGKNRQGCILDISKHKLIINEKNLEEERTDHCLCTLQTSLQVSDFNIDNSASQLQQKSDAVLFPAIDFKEKDIDLICGDYGLSAMNSSQEHGTIQANTPSRSCLGQPSECDIKNMDSLSTGKICRKVKILLQRNKKNLEPNVDLEKRRTECLIIQEENRICSSQSLLDLFQTSEETSEFLGFTSYTGNGGICDSFDIWREDDSSLSSIFSSFPSNSTFTGF